jgi:death-on-curing protein
VESPIKRIVVPTIREIVETNKLFVETTGGKFYPPDNLRYRDGLMWALETIQCPLLFGIPMYPLLSDKASLLAWTIINDHVFLDGNKRTGMATIKILVLSNGHIFSASDKEIEDMAHKIHGYRKSGLTKESLSAWISKKM